MCIDERFPQYIVSKITGIRGFLKRKISIGILLTVLVIAGIRMSGSAQFAVMTKKAERAEYTLCIDSGHGGNDPGKIGVAGTKEKEVNLTIALKLKKHLERQNIRVIMTRTDDRNLADANATNEKISDMKRRVAKMNSEQPDAVISIHQNSYTDSSVKGAQVFYYEGSKEGKNACGTIAKESDRQCGSTESSSGKKANSGYYILKKNFRTDGDRGMRIPLKPGRRKPADKCRIPGKNWWKPCRRGSARIWWSINKSSVRASERLAA